MKFFLNSKSTAYLRNLESEFGESTNAIRLELNKFEKAGLLISEQEGNKKIFRANVNHPLYNDIHNILLKHVGFDQIVERVINKLGSLDKVFVTGDFAEGRNSGLIDLVFVGEDINKTYLTGLIDKTEKLIRKKIRYVVFGPEEFEQWRKDKDDSGLLLLWKNLE